VSARERWLRFWFEPSSPLSLGICRVLFFGFLLVLYVPRDFAAWGRVSSVFWEPTWLFQVLRLPLLPAPALELLQWVWKAALALSCVGLLTRLATGVAFILGAYLIGLPHCFGKIHHNEAVVVLVLGILALSRCGDAVSLDRLIRRRRDPDSRPDGPPRSGEYTWPVRMVWVVMALVFFAAGLAKLRHSGLVWVTSDNLAIMMIQNNYAKVRTDPLTMWGLVLARHGWLCRALAGATLAVELGYPLALVSRRARWLFVPASCLMVVGIRLVLGPAFEQFLVCSLFWVPWDRLVGRIRPGVASRASRAGPRVAPAGGDPG
jgi:hypothetical protein